MTSSLCARIGASGCLVAAAMAVGCAGGAARWPRPDRVVLITIDTLRADHVSAFGHPISTTPWFDALAAEGTLFTRAYAQSATTKPSHSSMFTSLYPLQHGVLNNGLVLDEELVTLAELFRDAGYRTAAFVSTDAPLGGNVNQGFEVWNQYHAADDAEGGKKQYRQAEHTVNRALEWAGQVDPDEPFFLWVHVYDPHRPIQPPEDDVARVREMIQAYGEEAYRSELVRRSVPADRPGGFEDAVLYDAEIHYADGQLGRLHAGLGELGLLERSLWVVTADHGQGLGAHDWYGHSKQIYNAQVHVPLLFWSSEQRVGREIGDRLVEHVDLLPTLAELARFEPQQILPIQGRSLAPVLRGEVAARDRRPFAFSERSRYVDAGPQQQERGNYEEGSRYALQDLQLKYILFTEGEDELYDLRADPYEMHDLIASAEHAEASDQMREALAQLIATLPSGRQAESVSAEEIARLRALGYIQ